MRHWNIVMRQRITKKWAHNKKTGTRNLQTGPRNPKQEPLLIPLIPGTVANLGFTQTRGAMHWFWEKKNHNIWQDISKKTPWKNNKLDRRRHVPIRSLNAFFFEFYHPRRYSQACVILTAGLGCVCSGGAYICGRGYVCMAGGGGGMIVWWGDMCVWGTFVHSRWHACVRGHACMTGGMCEECKWAVYILYIQRENITLYFGLKWLHVFWL